MAPVRRDHRCIAEIKSPPPWWASPPPPPPPQAGAPHAPRGRGSRPEDSGAGDGPPWRGDWRGDWPGMHHWRRVRRRWPGQGRLRRSREDRILGGVAGGIAPPLRLGRDRRPNRPRASRSRERLRGRRLRRGLAGAAARRVIRGDRGARRIRPARTHARAGARAGAGAPPRRAVGPARQLPDLLRAAAR